MGEVASRLPQKERRKLKPRSPRSAREGARAAAVLEDLLEGVVRRVRVQVAVRDQVAVALGSWEGTQGRKFREAWS